MTSALRVGILLIIFLATLSACAAPASPASAPTATAREPVAEAGSSDRVELASGRYQLLMFYSPI